MLDWGIRPLERPALYVDHHALEVDTLRDDQVAVCGRRGPRGESLTASSSRTCRRLATLVNSPRRVPGGPLRTALAILVEADTTKAALADARIAELEEAKA